MKYWKELLKNKEAVLDIANVLMGVVMLAAMLAYGMTRSAVSMYAVILSGGLLNVTNGLKLYQKKEKKTLGMSMMMLGAIILILCVMLV